MILSPQPSQPTAKSTEQNRTEQNEQATHYAYTVPGMDTITLPDTTARSRTEDTANNQSINQSNTVPPATACPIS